MQSIILSPDEIAAITGFAQPCKQLQALWDQGFTRARRNKTGTIIVERSHYEAVCSGKFASDANKPTGVKLDFFKTRAA